MVLIPIFGLLKQATAMKLHIPLRFFLIMVLIHGISSTLLSQIIFENRTQEPVYLATARYVNTGSTGYWITQGWWTVNSGSSHLAFQNIGAHDTIGYWCMSTLSEIVYDGNKNLLVHNDEKFTIKNADNQATANKFPQFEWRKFRLVRMKPGTLSGTITLK